MDSLRLLKREYRFEKRTQIGLTAGALILALLMLFPSNRTFRLH